MTWSPNSWRQFPVMQMPKYSDPAALDAAIAELSARPALVFAGEARKLRRQLADVAAGNAFLLQGGDCAESFKDFSTEGVRDTFPYYAQLWLGRCFFQVVMLAWLLVMIVRVHRALGCTGLLFDPLPPDCP